MAARVGDYSLVPYEGLWFLTSDDGHPVSTILDMGGGRWRARTLEGTATTFEPGDIPARVQDIARWIAEQITAT